MACASGTTCAAACIPVADACHGVTCGSDETCIAGACVAGCFPAPCNGVTCPAGQTCDGQTGKCAAFVACAATCGAGQACALTCVPPDPCAGVSCPAGQACAGGTCVVNRCASWS